jgi:tetratricopeptide (TPR) repeat protein
VQSPLWHEWDFEAAEKEFHEAKKITPNINWSDFLIASGRFEEAYVGTKQNIEIDPNSALQWAGRILSAYFVGKQEEAVTLIDSTMKKEDVLLREDLNVLSDASRVYMYMGRYEDAIKVVKSAYEYYPELASPRFSAIHAISLYKMNHRDQTTSILKVLKDKSEVNAGGSPSFHIAMIYAQMDEIDLAFQWLDKAYQDHEVEMYWLKVEPPFEPLHGDPRWQVMLDKVGFPK